MESEFITLARVLKTQGRWGEVAVELHSDVPDRFKPGMQILALAAGANLGHRELEVEDVWPHKGMFVLKFASVNSISEAESLVGCELQVPRQQRAKLERGWSYVSDLIGCLVFDGDREIGKVENVQFGAGEAPLLMVTAGEMQHQIPYAEAYLRYLDLGQKQIQMSLPDGILELNDPLSAEEKEHQKKIGLDAKIRRNKSRSQ